MHDDSLTPRVEGDWIGAPSLLVSFQEDPGLCVGTSVHDPRRQQPTWDSLQSNSASFSRLMIAVRELTQGAGDLLGDGVAYGPRGTAGVYWHHPDKP